MTRPSNTRRTAVVLTAVLVVLATMPGLAAAETRVRPTVEVPAGETLNEDLTAAAAQVVIHGTVDGDVTALAGSVVVTGEVTGDVTAVSGRVDVSGRVGGSIVSIAGATTLDGDVREDVDAIGGSLSLGGPVSGSVDAVGIAVTVETGSVVAGRLQTTSLVTRVNGSVLGRPAQQSGAGANNTSSAQPAISSESTENPRDAATIAESAPGSGGLVPVVAQTVLVSADRAPVQVVVGPGGLVRVSWLDLYGFFANLLLGVVLVGLFPRFSRRVATLVADEPARTWGTGLLVALLVPLALALVGLSLFGLPIAMAGSALFVVLAWIGAVYARFAIGMWLLSAVPRALAVVGYDRPPVENRWLALVVGAFVVGLLLQLPTIGPVLDGLVLLFGVGGVTRLAYRTYERSERTPDAAQPSLSEPTSGSNDD